MAYKYSLVGGGWKYILRLNKSIENRYKKSFLTSGYMNDCKESDTGGRLIQQQWEVNRTVASVGS